MYTLFLIVHVLVCFFLIVVILLQSGQAADLAGAFGGMGSQTAFGPRGSATLLSKATTASAVIFMVTSLGLSILATRNAGLGTTVLEGAPNTPAQTKTVPVNPSPVPGSPQPIQSAPVQIPVPPPANQKTAPNTKAPAPANQNTAPKK